MEGNGKLMTIKEASNVSGLAISTLYKAVQKGILPVEYGVVQGKEVKKVKKTDVIRIFELPDSMVLHDITPGTTPDITPYNTVQYDRISEIVGENIKKAIEEKETKLMKPLEEQAMFIAGKLQAENQFLKEKLETVLEENKLLQNSIKALPGPVEEVNNKLIEQETAIVTLEIEITELHKENTVQAEKVKEQSEIIQQQKEHFQEEEKDYFATIGELKRQLEEERNKPWWKKIF